MGEEKRDLVSWFAGVARRLGAATRQAGLTVPAFRAPPRKADATRTIRRYPGGAVVSVALHGRERAHIANDMIEGVLVVNRLTGPDADPYREVFILAVAPTFQGEDPEPAGGKCTCEGGRLSPTCPVHYGETEF